MFLTHPWLRLKISQYLGDTLFISRLPAVYSIHDEVVEEAVEKDHWMDIGSLNEVPSSRKRPPAVYQATESTVTIDEVEYRAIVYSS